MASIMGYLPSPLSCPISVGIVLCNELVSSHNVSVEKFTKQQEKMRLITTWDSATQLGNQAERIVIISFFNDKLTERIR